MREWEDGRIKERGVNEEGKGRREEGLEERERRERRKEREKKKGRGAEGRTEERSKKGQSEGSLKRRIGDGIGGVGGGREDGDQRMQEGRRNE